METRDDGQQKSETPPSDIKERKRRFRIVKLEERIAPGANNTHGGYCNSNGHACQPTVVRTCQRNCY
jgi:hypothetical protein